MEFMKFFFKPLLWTAPIFLIAAGITKWSIGTKFDMESFVCGAVLMCLVENFEQIIREKRRRA